MKKKKKSTVPLLEIIVLDQIIDFIFDRKSKIVLTEIEPEQINLFTKISSVLDAASLQHLLARLEDYHRIRIDMKKFFNWPPSTVCPVRL